MIDQIPIARQAFFCLLFFTVISVGNKVAAQNGQALFKLNCASCHAINKKVSGPPLMDVDQRVPDKPLLKSWIKNNQKVLASGNPYFNNLYAQYNKTPMNNFEGVLSDADIEAILGYIKTEGEKLKAESTTGGPTDAIKYDESDNSILYGILTLILAVIALILLGVNSNLRKLADEKEGTPSAEPIPFYRNKSYITLLTLILFVVGGFFITKAAIRLGRLQGYEPEQPIFYSHKVHAGKNQINCLYCHGSAFEGKQANIPSVNICMNCHMQINEYSAKEKLYKDGKEVNGTAEIQKIYEAAGWDPNLKKYVNAGKPIAWVRIHNLPDHVFFSHAQHTRAGKVQCQTCHGEITAMDEVYQFAELSMGWCVNCHRVTKVDFNNEKGEGNKFYSIYQKYHDEIKSGKRDSVTVNDIGGTECQKCHY